MLLAKGDEQKCSPQRPSPAVMIGQMDMAPTSCRGHIFIKKRPPEQLLKGPKIFLLIWSLLRLRTLFSLAFRIPQKVIEVRQSGPAVPALPLSGVELFDSVQVILVVFDIVKYLLNNAGQIDHGFLILVLIDDCGCGRIQIIVILEQNGFCIVQPGLTLL